MSDQDWTLEEGAHADWIIDEYAEMFGQQFANSLVEPVVNEVVDRFTLGKKDD